MPHFLAHFNSNALNYPLESGDFCFIKELISLKNSYKSYVYASFKNQVFLLQKIKRSNDFLIKTEKATPLDREIAKSALRAYAQFFEVKSHNLQENSRHASEKKALNLETFESFIKECQAPILIEIGFGSGRHLLELARNNPNKICLGIEIYTPSIAQVLKQVELQNLSNLIVLQADARLVLESMHNQTCEKIFVHFPVPWNDKKHRRVLSEKFLNEALRVLKVGGMLELRTDDEIYFKDSLNLVLENPKAHVEIKKNAPSSVISKYEARWNKLEKNIYDLRVIALKEAYSLEKFSNFDFSFETLRGLDEKMEYLLKIPKRVKEGYFVHVCNVYTNCGEYLIELSLGDFDWPMRLFVRISNGGKVSYLNKTPLKTLANYKAHQLLANILKQEEGC
ncbi:tRNA (guanosine(46)-N7)-methyltransferase TrmB [Helicobacter cetorum]|uniref:tRNA (guanosine(46)-N7)-methyltransferase TrmB n=1 Tax=Helicobacter cetorum TaxID=138563 RepID=UPI000CF196B5|nr:tRNA (guanosine(46)-N7)-methyltransferase TrmB [Helicobacter cetorum]